MSSERQSSFIIDEEKNQEKRIERDTMYIFSGKKVVVKQQNIMYKNQQNERKRIFRSNQRETTKLETAECRRMELIKTR